jgi:hypothetical protein
MESNFLINKVKNRGKFLFTSYLPGTNIGVGSSKGYLPTPLYLSTNLHPSLSPLGNKYGVEDVI